jgi:3-deoxy-D-manno-octulosonate 8-phosphate phosphatase (KDO 8-P phosphatase)
MSGQDTCGKGDGYPSDCEITQGLLNRAMNRQQEEAGSYARRACFSRAEKIKLLLLDVDGVLTNGTIIYTPSGGESKAFNTRDGFGIRLLREAGVEVGLITARISEAVQRRAEELKLKHVYQGMRNKAEAYDDIIASLGLSDDAIAYMGDDWLDLPVLTRVGFAVAVADALPEVREAAHYVTCNPGGYGAVREVCDLIIDATGQRQSLLAKYIR